MCLQPRNLEKLLDFSVEDLVFIPSQKTYQNVALS